MSELDVELERRTLTYTLWNNSPNKTESKGWHPMTFNHANAAPQKIREIKVNTTTLYSSYHFRFSLAVSDVVYYIYRLTDYNASFSTLSLSASLFWHLPISTEHQPCILWDRIPNRMVSHKFNFCSLFFVRKEILQGCCHAPSERGSCWSLWYICIIRSTTII